MKVIQKDILEKIVPLYKTGITQQEVADQLGISISTVGRHIKAAGYDRTHVGGMLSKAAPCVPIAAPKAEAKEPEALVVTGRTLNMHGSQTGCDYTAGTHNENVDITLADWMMSIPVTKLEAFINELSCLRKMVGI